MAVAAANKKSCEWRDFGAFCGFSTLTIYALSLHGARIWTKWSNLSEYDRRNERERNIIEIALFFLYIFGLITWKLLHHHSGLFARSISDTSIFDCPLLTSLLMFNASSAATFFTHSSLHFCLGWLSHLSPKNLNKLHIFGGNVVKCTEWIAQRDVVKIENIIKLHGSLTVSAMCCYRGGNELVRAIAAEMKEWNVYWHIKTRFLLLRLWKSSR